MREKGLNRVKRWGVISQKPEKMYQLPGADFWVLLKKVPLMETFSLANVHNKNMVFLILYTGSMQWLLAALDWNVTRKKERGKRCRRQLWIESAGVRSVLCRSQKTLSSTLPFRSPSWTEIEHRRCFLGKTPFSQSFTTEKWSKWVAGYRPLAPSDWESIQHCRDTELCQPMSTLREKYSTEPSSLLQTTHPFKLIGVTEKLKCSAYLQSYRFM